MADRAQDARMALGPPGSIPADGVEETARELEAYYALDALDAEELITGHRRSAGSTHYYLAQ